MSFYLAHVVFMLDMAKMDGAGFVLVMQQTMAAHITSLLQYLLDQWNETDLLAALEKDVNAIDQVLAAFFDLLTSSLSLVGTLGVLFYLSWELSLLVVGVIPFFLFYQQRQAAFVVRASDGVRKAEKVFLREIEENLVKATTKTLLGLDRHLDSELRRHSDALVEANDVLDIANARGARALDWFGLVMQVGIVILGIVLMTLEALALRRRRLVVVHDRRRLRRVGRILRHAVVQRLLAAAREPAVARLLVDVDGGDADDAPHARRVVRVPRRRRPDPGALPLTRRGDARLPGRSLVDVAVALLFGRGKGPVARPRRPPQAAPEGGEGARGGAHRGAGGGAGARGAAEGGEDS